MTRSANSPAKVAKKKFREKARAQGIPFPVAIAKAKESVKAQNEYPATTRRNAGRMDGVSWNGASFICSATVGDLELCDPCYCDIESDEFEDMGVMPDRKFALDIFSIARPAKLKGVAKEFEVVKTLERVIVLEETNEDEDEEDWDLLYHTDIKEDARKMYSEAVACQGQNG